MHDSVISCFNADTREIEANKKEKCNTQPTGELASTIPPENLHTRQFSGSKWEERK